MTRTTKGEEAEAQGMEVCLHLSEETYRLIEMEAKRRGLSSARELLIAWILEKAMQEIKVGKLR